MIAVRSPVIETLKKCARLIKAERHLNLESCLLLLIIKTHPIKFAVRYSSVS